MGLSTFKVSTKTVVSRPSQGSITKPVILDGFQLHKIVLSQLPCFVKLRFLTRSQSRVSFARIQWRWRSDAYRSSYIRCRALAQISATQRALAHLTYTLDTSLLVSAGVKRRMTDITRTRSAYEESY